MTKFFLKGVNMSTFIPNSTLKNEIEKGVPIRIRAALLNYFMEDRADEKKQIRSAIAYTEKNFPQLWQVHDAVNYPMKQNKSEWNDKYYNLQSLYCNDNFSKERINHLLEVGKHLYTKPNQATTSVNQSNVKKNTTTTRTLSQNQSQRKQRNHSQNKNQSKTLLMLSILIIAIIVIVVIVIVMNNNQPQAMIPLKNQIAKSVNQVTRIVHLNL